MPGPALPSEGTRSRSSTGFVLVHARSLHLTLASEETSSPTPKHAHKHIRTYTQPWVCLAGFYAVEACPRWWGAEHDRDALLLWVVQAEGRAPRGSFWVENICFG